MAAPTIPSGEVDDNLNPLTPDYGDVSLHKQDMDRHHWLTFDTLDGYWKRLGDEWAANPCKPGVVEAFRIIRIEENDWELLLEEDVEYDEDDEDDEDEGSVDSEGGCHGEGSVDGEGGHHEEGSVDGEGSSQDEDREKRQIDLVKIAVIYWQNLTRFGKEHGSKAQFLTINLQSIEECDLNGAIESCKISFMASLPEMFPNLSGLKLGGNGLGVLNDDNLQIIQQSSQKNWLLPIMSLDIGHRFSIGYLGLAGYSLIKGCSDYLKELHVSHVQIRQYPTGVVLDKVAKLTLRKFGGEVSTSGEWFRQRISNLMPNLKTLAIEETFNDFVNGLGALVNHLITTTGLQTLSVTMDGRHYSEEDDSKIGSLHTLKLVLSPFGLTNLAIFNIIPDVTQLVVANIEKSDITEDRLLSLLSDRGVRYDSIRFIK